MTITHTAAGWVAPWTPGLEQARCTGINCSPGQGLGEHLDRLARAEQPDGTGKLVVAITLDDSGLCVTCARTPGDDDRRRLDYTIADEAAYDALRRDPDA